MKICFICTEIFAWGKFGGFGRVTRKIGIELVKKGFDVYAVVPKRNEQKDFEILDGIKVFGFPKYNPLAAKKLFINCNADIYHSEEPSLLTYIAQNAMPSKIHLVTSRDPRNFVDWISEFIHPSYNIFQVTANFIFENNFLVSRAVRKANKVFCTAKFLEEIVVKKYKLKEKVDFLPTPTKIPQKEIVKSEKPKVCFISRLDRRKRPELFFELAKHFPNVQFIAVGESRNKNYEKHLRNKYSNLKNLEIKGFVNQFDSDLVSKIFEESWILVNTAVREGLPNSFLEALAHQCAILSSVNPENVTEHFGYHVTDNNFQAGLTKLLDANNWITKGQAGKKYVLENYELNKAIAEHIHIYSRLLNQEKLN